LSAELAAVGERDASFPLPRGSHAASFALIGYASAHSMATRIACS
jgi:hypothetical protein